MACWSLDSGGEEVQVMSNKTSPVHTHRDPAERHLRLAWVFVALTVPAFVGAMFLGEGLLSALGYSSDDTSIPFDVVVRAGGPALLLMVTPPALAVWYGLRARREGSPQGFVPAVVGATIAIGAVGLNVASYVLALLFG
jgi:hypothetical protein